MRLASLFGFGAALVCAAFLVACGGGGGRSSPISGGGSLSGGHSTNAQSAGTRVTVVINRTPHTGHTLSKSRRGAQASRSPKYIPSNANGLQLTVSGTGGASQTVYADVSPSSPLCSTSNYIETCVIAVPTLAASEQFAALETDSLPTNENVSGYGTGFGTGSNILGAINQSQTVQLGGANAIGLELGPVSGHFYDCSGYATVPTSLPSPYSPNFGIDTTAQNDPTTGARIVVTAGVAATGAIAPEFCNPGPSGSGYNSYQDYDSTPAPFVDVNGSPTPITLTSNTSALTLAPVVNNGTAPPASAYSQTASIANDGFEWFDCNFFVGVKTSASFTAPATIVVNNNLTAINPFTSSNYASTMTYTVAAISVSSATTTVSQSGTVYLTATDYGAAVVGTDGESTYGTSTPGDYGDEDCKTSGGTTLAYAYEDAAINTTNWTQQIEIDGAGAGTGTCTFYVFDREALTVTTPVTVTVTP